MKKSICLAIFDLDGVLVDTAEYHYQAWKLLASKFGYSFSRKENEAFKGVSRNRCMDLLCGYVQQDMTPDEKRCWADWKNNQYLRMISGLDRAALLPGSLKLLENLRIKGVQIALGSASKNARTILERLEIGQLFDCIVDGTMVSRAKPDPQVFLLSAEALDIAPEKCVVFEDSQAGIEAAHYAGMRAVGVGDRNLLSNADVCVQNLLEMDEEKWQELCEK